MSFNRVFLLGRLGADPEIRFSQSQMPICSLKIATSERKKGQDGQWADHTEWHNVITFDKTAENCGKFLQKGSQCLIEGKIQTRKYQDKDGKDCFWTEIVANNVQFIGSKGKGGESSLEMEKISTPNKNSSSQVTPAMPQQQVGEAISFEDDDIPF